MGGRRRKKRKEEIEYKFEEEESEGEKPKQKPGTKKRRVKDFFTDEIDVIETVDDTQKAAKVRTERDLRTLVNSQTKGAVQVTLWDEQMLEYNPGGEITVHKENVKAAAAKLVKEVQDRRQYDSRSFVERTNIRFNRGTGTYETYTTQAHDFDAQLLGLTTKEYDKLEQDEYIARAYAIETAARVGKVKLTKAQQRYIDQFKEDDYKTVIWGRETSLGYREYEKRHTIQRGPDADVSAVNRARYAEYAEILAEGRRTRQYA